MSTNILVPRSWICNNAKFNMDAFLKQRGYIVTGAFHSEHSTILSVAENLTEKQKRTLTKAITEALNTVRFEPGGDTTQVPFGESGKIAVAKKPLIHRLLRI